LSDSQKKVKLCSTCSECCGFNDKSHSGDLQFRVLQCQNKSPRPAQRSAVLLISHSVRYLQAVRYLQPSSIRERTEIRAWTSYKGAATRAVLIRSTRLYKYDARVICIVEPLNVATAGHTMTHCFCAALGLSILYMRRSQ
jgi:hypothetical protein